MGVIPDFIDSIKNKSKKVILVLGVNEFDSINGKPIFDGYIESLYQDSSATNYLKTPAAIDQLKKLFFNSQKHDKDQINEVLREIAKANQIVVLDKTDFICDVEAQTCEGITAEGYKSFFDYGHFTLEGAMYFGRRIYEIGWLKIDCDRSFLG